MFSSVKCAKMTKQAMRGPELDEKWDFCNFRCSDCGLNCYRKRKLGNFYDSSWTEWEAFGIDELQQVGEPVLCNDIVCSHVSAKVQTISKSPTKQVAQLNCSSCNLNCKIERVLGYIWHGDWIKVAAKLEKKTILK